MEIESWLVQRAVFTILLISQINIRRDVRGTIALISMKVKEDFLLPGDMARIKDLSREISKRYKVRKIIIYNTINFNGCKITQDHICNIRMDMSDFVSAIKPT